jgi:hypothetical protein
MRMATTNTDDVDDRARSSATSSDVVSALGDVSVNGSHRVRRARALIAAETAAEFIVVEAA